jgi:2-hydroxychromene-2-carboxylate isomerase
LVRIGADEGLTGAGFAGCVGEGRYRSWAAHNTEVASERGVITTPTIFVDGEPLEERSADGLIAAVEAASS